MAEVPVTDTSTLNPESAEFVPAAKLNQQHSRRNYRQREPNQDWRANHVRPHHHLRESRNRCQDEFENPTAVLSEPPIRGGSRNGGRGRVRGGPGNGGHADEYRPHSGRFTQPPIDGCSSRKEYGGHGRNNPSTSNRLRADEKKEGSTVEANGRETNRDSGWKKSSRPRDERSMKEPRDHEGNQASGRDTVQNIQEHDQRSHKGWRGGDHRMQSGSRRKVPAPNHGIEGNWRERESVKMMGPETEDDKHEDLRRNRGDVKEKRPPLQNSGPRRGGGSERRAANCTKPLKSKESQTGCLIEQLTEEKYECMVCCDTIRLVAPVWSCQSCFHVFHLNCIKKWARSPTSQADDGKEGWRCPACQHVTLKVPNAYTCFCGKVCNPEFQRTEIPHSCGDMCGKKRNGGDCSHPCNIKQVRCSQPGPLLCEDVCGALLNCSQHKCAQVCHASPCPPCKLLVQQACFCGVVFRDVACGTDSEHFDGSGYFSCSKTCGKILDCQSHHCQQFCHPGQCQPCPLSPKLVHSCSCGQTPLSKLLELGYPERKTCTDPIPSCGKTCNKPLPCGDYDSVHLCEKLCHEDICGPCSLTSSIKCRCGSNSKDMEHKCAMICGYKLNCGLHRCQELCHRGNCQPCWQTSFDELACYCGETVLFPPIPCGTRPPECKNVCTRGHECDHPVFHSCHNEEKCPPCTYLMKKWCMGNHEERSNIPCHLQDISCGLVCDKLLDCGSHHCKRICHRGDCQEDGVCKQPCIFPKPGCSHPCAAPCHPGMPCPPSVCSAKVPPSYSSTSHLIFFLLHALPCRFFSFWCATCSNIFANIFTFSIKLILFFNKKGPVTSSLITSCALKPLKSPRQISPNTS
ncbi:hypothetical protein DNTS_020306 [Danionella cerebrum]|uniref:RING-type domain-containing protein n=1 Tax=Danionella cerebrum TaxID=2873325 RepID=A0A553RD75_9TELE|nr:hypothetical protein DNTS_020306 [Danionella translucida]